MGMTKDEEKTLVMVYYLSRLHEMGAISQSLKLTSKGFDLAYDLSLEIKFDVVDIATIIMGLKLGLNEEDFVSLCMLVEAFQNLGYEQMKKEMNELQELEKLKNK